jgi:hypothetical protein
MPLSYFDGVFGSFGWRSHDQVNVEAARKVLAGG